MGLMGFKTLDVKASSTAAWGTKSLLRVALVLDNTGSMASGGKMTALQTAAKKMLSKLDSATQTTGDVYVSIIPFAKDVNFGSSNYNQALDAVGRRHRQLMGWQQGNLQPVELQHAQRVHRARRDVLDFRQHDPGHLHGCGHVLDLWPDHPEHLHGDGHLLEYQVHNASKVHQQGRHMDGGQVDDRRVDQPGDLDTDRPQHLDRLRRRPR